MTVVNTCHRYVRVGWGLGDAYWLVRCLTVHRDLYTHYTVLFEMFLVGWIGVFFLRSGKDLSLYEYELLLCCNILFWKGVDGLSLVNFKSFVSADIEALYKKISRVLLRDMVRDRVLQHGGCPWPARTHATIGGTDFLFTCFGDRRSSTEELPTPFGLKHIIPCTHCRWIKIYISLYTWAMVFYHRVALCHFMTVSFFRVFGIFFFFFRTLLEYFPDFGQAVVTGVVPSPPRFLPSLFIAHWVQKFHCSSIFHRVLLTHALELSAKSICAQGKVPTNSYQYALGVARTHETDLYQARG